MVIQKNSYNIFNGACGIQIQYYKVLGMSLEKDVNKAIEIAGNKGRYQIFLMTILCLIFYFDAFLVLGPSFFFMDPTFICDGSDEVVDESIACPKLAECHIVNDFTITKRLGLYCDRQGERDVIQAVLSVGSLLGLVLMNFLSDIRGRKLALVVDLMIASLSSLLTTIGAYAGSTPLLIISSLMAGFSGYSLFIISYIIAGDVCEEQMRQKSSLYMNMVYSLGLITFFFQYNWINQWYNILVLFMVIPFFGLSIVAMIFVQESPNYYLCKRKEKAKCIQSLTHIALYNNKGEDEIGAIQKLITDSEMSQQQSTAQKSKKSVFSVLKQWKYLKIIIFMAITEAGGNLFFFGIEYAIDDIGFNYGVDNLVLGSTEIVATFFLTRFIAKLNRRKTLLISYLCTVAVSLIFLIGPVQKSDVICTILIIFIRISTTSGYFMIVMIQTESFPLQIQSIGAGAIEAFAQLGSITAPLIIIFAVNNGLQKMATMGVILLLCLIPLKFVPEPQSSINKQELSQTLLESQLQ